MASSRFQTRGVASPVVGGVQVISKEMEASASATEARVVRFPAGMAFEVTDVLVEAQAKTGTVLFHMGTAAAGTAIVDEKAVTTTAITCTVVDGTVPAGGAMHISLTAGAGETATGVQVSIIGYPLSEPTSVKKR